MRYPDGISTIYNDINTQDNMDRTFLPPIATTLLTRRDLSQTKGDQDKRKDNSLVISTEAKIRDCFPSVRRKDSPLYNFGKCNNNLNQQRVKNRETDSRFLEELPKSMNLNSHAVLPPIVAEGKRLKTKNTRETHNERIAKISCEDIIPPINNTVISKCMPSANKSTQNTKFIENNINTSVDYSKNDKICNREVISLKNATCICESSPKTISENNSNMKKDFNTKRGIQEEYEGEYFEKRLEGSIGTGNAICEKMDDFSKDLLTVIKYSILKDHLDHFCI